MTIRNVTPADIEQIATIERECFSLPWDENMLRVQLREHHIFLAAMNGETVLGYVGLMYVLDEGYISNVAVSPLFRRKGIADALIEEIKCNAEKFDLSFITLEARESNMPATALYRKHGFVEAGRRKNYYEKPCEDAIIMTYKMRD